PRRARRGPPTPRRDPARRRRVLDRRGRRCHRDGTWRVGRDEDRGKGPGVDWIDSTIPPDELRLRTDLMTSSASSAPSALASDAPAPARPKITYATLRNDNDAL